MIADDIDICCLAVLLIPYFEIRINGHKKWKISPEMPPLEHHEFLTSSFK